MKQQTLAGFEKYGETIRCAQFLAEIYRVMPRAELAAVIEPVYSKGSANDSRPPTALEHTLRMYFLQAWFNVSDPGQEDAAARKNSHTDRGARSQVTTGDQFREDQHSGIASLTRARLRGPETRSLLVALASRRRSGHRMPERFADCS